MDGDMMKGIVAFDSVYGNTMKVAEAIAATLSDGGIEVEVIDLGKHVPRGVEGDLLFIGSPTRMGRMTGRTKKFIKRLKKDRWSTRPVVAFDTMLKLPEGEDARRRAEKWTDNGAGPRIKELAQARGLNVHEEVLRVEVTGIKGPLASDGLDKAKDFTRAFLDGMASRNVP